MLNYINHALVFVSMVRLSVRCLEAMLILSRR